MSRILLKSRKNGWRKLLLRKVRHFSLSDFEAMNRSGKGRSRIEELERSLFDLSDEMAAGQHVPPNIRVLSVKDNPEQEWFDLRQAAMDRLKDENQALMKRLKELEESGAKSIHIDDGRSTEPVLRKS